MVAYHMYVDPPVLREYPYGLLSVADTKEGDGHWQTGIDYESDLCGADLNTAGLYCMAPAGTNEVQTLAVTGTPTGGTYTLTFNGETTTALAYNATAPVVQAALEALVAFQPGDVVVSGTYPSYNLTFGGAYAASNVPQITSTAALTGGTTPGVTMATSVAGVRTPKITTENSGVSSADPFTLYALRACRSIGDWQRATERANNLLQAGEQRGIEKAVWALMTASGAGASDLTVGGAAVKPDVGLGVLEYWAAQHYGGVPTVHIPRDVGSILATRLGFSQHGNHMETKMGTLVAAGGGYSKVGINAVSGLAGEAWMFITGTVRLWRGTANIKGPLMVQTNMDNTEVVLAERSYLAAYDCLLAGIRVLVS